MFEQENWDTWSDADMADQSALPEKQRLLGYVSSVAEDVAEKTDGTTFSDGRTKVPQVVVTFYAVGVAGKGKFPADVAYYQTATKKFWVGQVDVESRRYLRRLIESGAGKSKEEVGQLGLLGASKLLEKVYFTYEVTNKEGSKGGTFSTAVKIKPATLDEVKGVV